MKTRSNVTTKNSLGKVLAGDADASVGRKVRSQPQSPSEMKSGKSSKGWKNSPVAALLVGVICIAMLAIAAVEIRSYFNGNTPGDPNVSIYVDAQTNQSFPHRNVVGESIPILSPFTNANNGYPGVPCYWTKSGQLRDEPYWLVLNSALGKPEPTFCPDCGRLVRPLQPRPKPGDKPPPTREELLHNYP